MSIDPLNDSTDKTAPMDDPRTTIERAAAIIEVATREAPDRGASLTPTETAVALAAAGLLVPSPPTPPVF